jgi:hypothetical protein
VTLVAVAGSTLSPYEWEHLIDRLNSTPDVLVVMLHVSLEESTRRAQADPLRVHSTTEDSERLSRIESLYARIDWSNVTRCDLEIQTDGRDVDEVVSLIAEDLSLAAIT